MQLFTRFGFINIINDDLSHFQRSFKDKYFPSFCAYRFIIRMIVQIITCKQVLI